VRRVAVGSHPAALLQGQQAIETALYLRVRDVFNVQVDVVLYK
jgi:hypothetical protein